MSRESKPFFENMEETDKNRGFLNSLKKRAKPNNDYDPFIQQETRFYQHDFKKRAIALLVIVLVGIIVGYALLTRISFDKVDLDFNKNQIHKQQKKKNKKRSKKKKN